MALTDVVQRYSVESLLEPGAGARVLRSALGEVEVHCHDYYELSLVTAGAAEHVVNGRTHVLRPGGAFLLSPADLHSLHALGDEPLTCYNAVLAPDLVERGVAGFLDLVPDGLPWMVDDFADAEPDLARLCRELDDPGPGSTQLTSALVACLVVELGRRRGVGVAEPRRAATAEDGVRAAVSYVDRHFREPLTLAGVAAVAHLSPNYFSERFGRHTGSSFQAYVQERRLRFARSLLVSTGLSVGEVAHASGFNELSHFGRAYRRRYGAPPSQHRAAAGSERAPADGPPR